MECHIWISVCACALKAVKARAIDVSVFLSFMGIPKDADINNSG
jgi:hypothetical protein